ncbi:MAG: N-acetyltransferase [Chloroflexota bacterium]|nr:MAG: N-acetyltransferase [Chloroflexota bacterium]
MEIIRATLDHLDAVAPLFDGYRQFYQQPSDLAAARSFLRARLSQGESVIFLAEIHGRPAGFTQLYPSWSSVSMRRLWILNDLFVHPDFRQRGVGEGLLERARQYAIETDAKGLMLETAVDNLPAQRLYERLGWVREVEFYTYTLATPSQP